MCSQFVAIKISILILEHVVITCSPACKNRGSCDTNSSRCLCPPGTEGEDCSVKLILIIHCHV